MNWKATLHAPTLVVFLLLSGRAYAAGQEDGGVTASYHLKPSEVVVPKEIPLGKYRRIITPFENWTLVCDENLKDHQRVCNISQVVEDDHGRMIFSWSLAATEDGKPFMILRIPPYADPNGIVGLKFPGRTKQVEVKLDGCNEVVCAGIVPVGPIMREQISKNAEPKVTFSLKNGQIIAVTATLKGLTTALKAIN